MLKLSSHLLKWSQFTFRNAYFCYEPHLLTKHYAELTMKATRRTFLSKAVLNQHKDVIYGQVRKPSDLVLKLKQEGKCPGVIIPFSNNKAQQIDIVLPGKSMKTRTKSPRYRLQKVFVRVEGKDYQCVLTSVKFNLKNFIEKVYFKEYVPGQPNQLKIPIQLTHLEENKLFHTGYELQNHVDSVEIICYNKQYPTMFYIDVSNVSFERPYKIGDLANTFPPGIILNSKMDINKPIFQILAGTQKVISQQDLDNAIMGKKSKNTVEDDATAQQKVQQLLANINYGMEKQKAKPAPTSTTPGKSDKSEAKTEKSAEKSDSKASAGKKKK